MSSNATLVRTDEGVLSRYWSCFRWPEILLLQGPPVLGVLLGRPSHETLRASPAFLVADILLVAHVFLLNDWAGLHADAMDPRKAAKVCTARGTSRRELLVLALVSLAVALGLMRGERLFFAIAIAGMSALYSLPFFDWKGTPVLGSVAHFVGGALHFLLGYVLSRPLDAHGFWIAAFFALVFTAGHLNQELRDREGDALSGIQTNAVAFGATRTFIASTSLFSCSHLLLFALALNGVLHRELCALLLLAPLHLKWSLSTFRAGLTYASICLLQARYRALYAVVGVALIASVFPIPW